jgi:hypothetical protein
LGTLPACTVLTGGIGGGGCSDPSGVLRGISRDVEDVPALGTSVGGVSGLASSSAASRALGGGGGGIGRVADGASGMSSGFCCATNGPASNPTSNNDSPSLNAPLIFVAIPESSIFLSSLLLRRFFNDSDAKACRSGASNHCWSLQDRLAKSREQNADA